MNVEQSPIEKKDNTEENISQSNESDVHETPPIKDDKTEDEEDSLLRIPLARVKKIMKQDPDVKLIANDSCFLITKATELFIEYFVSKSYNITQKDGRKIIQYRDLAKCVRELEELEFLNDIIPEQVSQ